jgi:hypothetical protein
MKYYIKTKDLDKDLENLSLPEMFKTALKASVGAAKGPLKEYLILESGQYGISVTDANRSDVPKEVSGTNKSIVLL